ncbi:unnamed protein product [Urochloa decumbens]|uniref:FAR1 domain-containing protein n=1 Tax=Urochloa decumbens TaxID=240449 RepID=A0ABC9AX50_9POAL
MADDEVAANSLHSGVGAHAVSGSSAAGNVQVQAGSGGVTVPTAETNFSSDEVEDGVEVISTPQEPCVGMVFATADAAKKYYNSYARHASFSIRIDSSRESKKTEEKTKYIYVCQRAGVNKKEKVATDGPITEKKIVRERRRDYVERTRCPARMIVRRTLHGQWEVVHFEKDHNHDRVKKFSLTMYLNSHRNIPPKEREFIRFLHGCNITTRAFQIMSDLYGGIDNCPYTEGDVKDLRVEYRAEYKCKDMKRDGVLCCHILKVFDTLAVREVPERYILPRWSAEILADDGIKVLGESLQAPEISSSGKHIVRYNRICTSFNKIIVPYMGDDEGYSIVSKHVAAMQSELNELKKRKASNVAPEPQSGQAGQSSGGAVASKSPEGGVPEIRDPSITKRQGRPRERRYKTGLDLIRPKPKPCNFCSSTEHTTAKCPTKPPSK